MGKQVGLHTQSWIRKRVMQSLFVRQLMIILIAKVEHQLLVSLNKIFSITDNQVCLRKS